MKPAAEALDALPRLGWVEEPSPVQALPALAQQLGLSWLGVKRDDQLGALHGGSKVRKLDALLACPPWRDAAALGALGAVGSGHLAALAAAGERLGVPVLACCFWSPLSAHSLENLAFVATRARIDYHRDRLWLGLRRPAAFGSAVVDGVAWMPPGGSAPEGLAGVVRAGLELARQVEAGLLPAPQRVLVPLGSGGLVAGLAQGLALAGLRPTIHAVSVLEGWSAPGLRLWRLQRALARWLGERGVPEVRPAPVYIERGHVGAGYGRPSPESWASVAELDAHGLPGEPAYSGKAWAALRGLARRHPGQAVLFWDTVRSGPLPVDPAWREALPPALRRRLDASPPLVPGQTLPRRHLLIGGAALLAAAGGAARVSGYRAFPAWDGALLSAWEAEVLRAAAEAVLPPVPADALDAIPRRTDRFLASLPEAARLEIHGLFTLIEHGTPLDLRLSRFSRLPVEARLRFLEELGRTRLGHLAAKGLRDLVLLGWYQDPRSWTALGYGGPNVPETRPAEASWEALRAPAGATPRSMA